MPEPPSAAAASLPGSPGPPSSPSVPSDAPVFAALGDETRLRLVSRLCADGPLSITQLTAGTGVTRQAVAKHLRVLEDAGLAHGTRYGRERVWWLEQRRLADARRHLEAMSAGWDVALDRLRQLVEGEAGAARGGGPPRDLDS